MGVYDDAFPPVPIRAGELESQSLHHLSYEIIPFDEGIGFVEVIPNARSMKEMPSSTTTTTGSLCSLVEHYPGGKVRGSPLPPWNSSCAISSITEERRNLFIITCAISSSLTYLLGVGDRHGGNIMVDPSAKMMHIDFGFMWGTNPKSGLGHTPVRLSTEMVEAMGGETSSGFAQFLCTMAKCVQLVQFNTLANLLQISAILSVMDLSSSLAEPDAEIIYSSVELSTTEGSMDEDNTENPIEVQNQSMWCYQRTNELLFFGLRKESSPRDEIYSVESGTRIASPVASIRDDCFSYQLNVKAMNHSFNKSEPLSKQSASMYCYCEVISSQASYPKPAVRIGPQLQAVRLYHDRLKGLINLNVTETNLSTKSQGKLWHSILLDHMERRSMGNRKPISCLDALSLSMVVSRVVIPSMGDIMANIVDKWQLLSSNFK
eukprot:GHVH01016022.1.p2 GENE.GHVH01016022.1~~GHVH01016022.1.p2  ORF type:complete len:433 (+),score=52.80 GHVH01016022.1:1601-2899(+)